METKEPLEIKDRRTQTIAADREALTGTEEPLSIEEAPDMFPRGTLEEVERVYADPIPIFDRILVRVGAAETYYQGTKFVIPESARKAPNVGVVVATANFYIVDGKPFPMAELVKPGDMVRFSHFNFEEIDIDGDKFQIGSIFDVKLIHQVTYAVGA